MRIGYVHERNGFFGGVEQNMFDTAVGLRTRGHECYLLAGPLEGRDQERFRSGFILAESRWSNGSPVGSDLLRAATALKLDALYFHKVPSSDFLDEMKGQIRTVRMIHDHDCTCPRRHKYFVKSGKICTQPIGWRCYLDLGFIEKKDGAIRLKSISKIAQEARKLNRYSMVVTNSESMKEELQMNGIDSSRLTITYPVVPDIDIPVSPVSADPHVLFVGQLIRGKGVDLLLRSLAKLTVPWHATIAGDGNGKASFEALSQELGLADRVKFLGWFPAGMARELYDSARVIAVPARWPEPFGMVGVEAMRRRRPVVGFRVGGIPDWLEDQETGYLVPEQDIDTFARRLEQLLTDADLANRLGSNGLIRAREQFGFDAYLDRLETIFAGDRAPKAVVA